MCGRYTARSPKAIYEEFDIHGDPPELNPRYNIAPTQLAPVVRVGADHARHWDTTRWGIQPQRPGAPVIMVRSESLVRGAFASSFHGRRCILAADGFFEWQHAGDKTRKVPYFIHRTNDAPLALAGIWTPGGPGKPDSFAVITRPAEAPVIDIHDRMPAIIAREDYDRWLNPDFFDKASLERILGREDGLGLTMMALGARVNSPKNDDPGVLEPAG